MSSYDDEEDQTAAEEDFEAVPEGFTVADNPNDPEVDLDESDLADFTFSDEDGEFTAEEDGGDSF
jgi:hypothetical protein